MINFVRIYNSNGVHVLSILPCSGNCYDLATPDGKVLHCDIPKSLFDSFAECLPIDSFDNP